MIYSFIFFLALIVLVGVLSSRLQQHNARDYLLASQQIKPWLVGLSAVATNNSGYMFVGMIGFTYTVGLSSMWLGVGWVLGDFFISFLVHKRLRQATQDQHILSFGQLLSNWYGQHYRWTRLVTGIIVILFLAVYAAAQLKAGSKALQVLFGWDLQTGAILGGLMVLIYCLAGGIRATIWTDAAQSFVMMASMLALLVAGIAALPGLDLSLMDLLDVSPTFMAIAPQDLFEPRALGFGLFIVGWMLAGVGVIGQPHIMSRFMALDQSDNMGRARTYYYLWYFLFFSLTIGVGLLSRLYLPALESFDPELALPRMSEQLFPPVVVGFILAGLFSATMSTADSQILSCTSSVINDLNAPIEKVWIAKLVTMVITMFAIVVALFGHDSVFVLVLVAWSILASAFAPLLILYALNQKPSEPMTIVLIGTGVAVPLLWRHFELNTYVFEVGPGIMIPLLIYGLCRLVKKT